MRKISEKEMIEVLSKILKINSKKINIKSKLRDINNWDSLNSLKVYMKLETITKRKLNISKLSEIETISDIYNYFK
jgi:acyl carrier protein